MAPEDRHDITAAQAAVDPDLLAGASRSHRYRAPHAPGILLAIALGGALGTPARYAIGRIIHVAPDSFPWSTFTVNVTGSLVLGVLLTLIIERWPPSRYLRPFAAIGFLGAYTTFSTYMVETDLLVRDGQAAGRAGLRGCQPARGICAVYLGIVIGRLRARRERRAWMKLEGRGERLTIFVGETDQHRHRPLYTEIIGARTQAGLAGATVLRGIEGFGRR